MRSIRRILVAVKNPTAKSLPAVAKAAQLARALNAQLELFHAISTPISVDAYSFKDLLPHVERTVRAECIGQLGAIAEKLRRRGLHVEVSAEWDHPPYEAVVRRAAHVKADLIVAERHGGRHLAAGLMRLTDWELLRHSRVPVLLVKTPGTYERPAILAAVDPGHSYAKPAKLDDEILRLACVFADALHGKLHAIHAYVPVPIGSFPDYTLAQDTVARLQTQTAAIAQRGFDQALRSVTIPRTRRHLVGRHPIDAIRQTAREIRSGLVVMGAISRSGLKRLFIGNTAESLLDRLTCDVLIIKPADFALRVQRRRRGARIAALVATPAM